MKKNLRLAVLCGLCSSNFLSAQSISVTTTGVGMGVAADAPTNVLTVRSTGSTALNLTAADAQESANTSVLVHNNTNHNGAFTQLVLRQRATDQTSVRLIAHGGTSPKFSIVRDGSEDFMIASNGKVGIGTNSPDYKLTVSGKVRATSFIANTNNYPDFVFKPDYKLPSLEEVEQHIQAKGHLPGIPSEKEAMETGIDIADLQVKMLEQIERLTLHAIRQEKLIKEQRAQIEALSSFRSEAASD